MKERKNPAERIQSWAPTKKKGLNIKPFRFLNPNSATTVPQENIHYRAPRLVKSKERTYVEYWYRIPMALAHLHGNKEWKRIRVFENINRVNKESYSKDLLASVENALKNGFSPFAEDLAALKIIDIAPVEWSLNRGLEEYIMYCVNKGLRKKTIQTYDITVNFMKDYFLKGNKIYQPISSFTKKDISTMLTDLKEEKQWTSGTYNNYLSLVSSIFNWFVREDKIDKSPVRGIDSKKVSISMHKYYDDAIAKKLKALIRADNPYLLSFCEFIYYTGTRPKSEARLLQVKHLLFERKLIFIPGNISKNKKDDYIPMAPELEQLLTPLKQMPPETYIWGNKGPDIKPASQNRFASQYKPYKDAMELSEEYTIYSWKHSRAIDLANAKVDPYAIMKLFRHSGLDITMKYLRDLGCDVNWEKYDIQKKF